MKKINFTKWALTLALSGFTFFPALQAENVYVSSSGNDMSAGTESDPVLTLTKAYQLIGNQAGTIYVSGNVPANTTGNGLDINGIEISVVGIEGTDAGISGDGNARLFYVRNNAVLTLENLHLDGNSEAAFAGQGGCVSFVQGGALFAENVTFENFSTLIHPDNDPANGGNQNNDTGSGGVVFVNQFNGSSSNPILSFRNCLFKNNYTTGTWGGGVIRVHDFGNVTNPHVYFENCGFYGSRTERGNPGGSVIVIRTGSGQNPQISFVNSTVTGTETGGSGAIALSSGNIILNLINTTIKDNAVSGVICWEQSNSTINIYNSVIENNVGRDMNDIRFSEKSGFATDSAKIYVSNSLIGNPLWRNRPADKIPYVKPAEYTVNDLFEPLDDATISFAPKAGSLVINYGDKQFLSELNINYDQLGNIRLFENDKCDIGSVEFDKKSVNGISLALVNNIAVRQIGESLIIDTKGSVGESRLVSISGQLVASVLGNEIPVANINTGMYILHVKIDGKWIANKVIVK